MLNFLLPGSDDELIISVKTYMVKDANKDEVLMYTAWIAGLFEDVVGSTLLTASIPYMITKRPKIPGTSNIPLTFCQVLHGPDISFNLMCHLGLIFCNVTVTKTEHNEHWI